MVVHIRQSHFPFPTGNLCRISLKLLSRLCNKTFLSKQVCHSCCRKKYDLQDIKYKRSVHTGCRDIHLKPDVYIHPGQRHPNTTFHNSTQSVLFPPLFPLLFSILINLHVMHLTIYKVNLCLFPDCCSDCLGPVI